MPDLDSSAGRFEQVVGTAQTLGEVLELLAVEVRNTIGFRSTWYGVLTPDRSGFRVLAAELSGGDDFWDPAAIVPIAGDPYVTALVETGEAQVTVDAQIDPDVNREIVEQLGNRTVINVPMFADGALYGSLGTGTFGDEGVRVPTDEELAYLQLLADATAEATVRILAPA
jgi:GAF domain-containing protein